MDLQNDITNKQIAYLCFALGSSFVSTIFPEWHKQETNIFNKARDVNKQWLELLGTLTNQNKLTKQLASQMISAHKEKKPELIRNILESLK